MDKKIYGRRNKVTMINPYKTHFVATYTDGKVIKGNDLINTGWDFIPNGLKSLGFSLSTGHFINIPKFKAYRPLIEVSLGMDGSKIFHAINVECLTDKFIIVYRIILKQDQISKYRIGDIVMSKKALSGELGKSWKYSGE